MSTYKPALWDGSDPYYAPGLTFTGRHAYWKAPGRYKQAGYTLTLINLRIPGAPEDSRQKERASLCREYTREMVRWFERLDKGDRAPGTWYWLIARYRRDEFSPFQGVKANTRESYEHNLQKWEAAIGHMKIAAMDYMQIKKIEKQMRENGRSDSYIHRMFTQLRMVSSYGKMLKVPEARDVSDILSEIRFRRAPARTVAPTRAHVEAVLAEADKRGMHGFALGLALMFEYALRAVDVRGQWLPAGKETGGIVRNGRRWADGLTWDMVSPDITSFAKVMSKTRRSMPEAMVFDLTAVPHVQTRMRLMASNGRVGPVIVTPRGLPYSKYAWSQAWSRLREAAGIPSDVWMMDTRAGAITEAKMMGVDAMLLRDMAGHANVTTTSRYARNRSEGAAKVVQIRREQK